ncbi:hypothetical protein VTJ04DRAFT_907 [Mycothermus thermophilus]|uniref:uncharacterized protein n=1 Tax=Humicola insolens TaxID=85995 RepID=UPI00374337A3
MQPPPLPRPLSGSTKEPARQRSRCGVGTHNCPLEAGKHVLTRRKNARSAAHNHSMRETTELSNHFDMMAHVSR